jgi:biopolymer transport protein ExbB/TolQ
MTLLASTSIEEIVFHIASVLRIPVLIAALIALVVVLAEGGALLVELWRRGRHSPGAIQAATRGARQAIADGDRQLAARELAPLASSAAMWATLQLILSHVGDGPAESSRNAKALADYDLRSLKRLERTRMLVRAGPALGLMGTLIPLSPALTGLADGNVKQLTSNLRIAFSVTVLGLLIGAIAFGISLVRDRLYAQDLSDMEAIASELELPAPGSSDGAAPRPGALAAVVAGASERPQTPTGTEQAP